MPPSSFTSPTSGPKALIFDLVGTCTDWYSSILPALQSAPPIPLLPPSSLPQLAVDWREGFFKETKMRQEAGQPVEDIDITHRRVLNWLLLKRGVTPKMWDDGIRSGLVGAWHGQRGWEDVMGGLERLRGKFIVVVLANGSTRYQIDIAKSSGLPFHMLFSSELLRQTKPDPGIYTKTLELLKIAPSEAMMVAAHAYDLRAAKKAGMLTAYIQRPTEDLHEDLKVVRGDVDFCLDGADGSKECGFGELASLLGV